MTHENEKICVLVPLTVNSINDQKEGDGNTQKKMENVRLAEKVLMKCKELIDNCYPMLSYDYSSLFMGNEKQLLVYRKCSSIERYLSKYRLP